MDKSKTYVKMCDCPEIQQEWETIRKRDDWDCSDFVYDKSDSHGVQVFCLGGASAFEEFLIDFIWLPRQDQTQEMMRKHYAQEINSKRPHDKWFPEGAIGLGYVLKQFESFTKSGYPPRIFHSFEQIWLACFIWEAHKKVWDDKKWMAIK